MTKIPKLRFKEFEGEWEEKKLGDIVQLSKLKYNPLTSEEEYKCIELENLSQETGKLLGYFNSKNQQSIKNKFKQDDILFGKLRPYLKKYWLAKFDGVCSSEIWVLSSKSILNKFVYLIIQTEKFSNISNTSSGTKMPRADWAYVCEHLFFIPLLKEQEKIASFLRVVDEKIGLEEDKLKSLKLYKKGLMQKIFNRELRFKDENGQDYPEWEEKRLGDLVDIGTGKKDTQDKVDDGIYPFFVRSQIVERINSYSFDGEAILTAGDGVGVGRVFHYINGKFDYHQRVYKLSHFKKGINGKYIYEYFKKNFIKEVVKYTAKTSVDSVRMEMITKMYIPIPSLKEQQKIGNFLSSIDNKIEKQEDKLRNLKLYKRGLLSQMFI